MRDNLAAAVWHAAALKRRVTIDGGWLLRECRAGGAFSLSAVDVALDVDELYEGAFDQTVAG